MKHYLWESLLMLDTPAKSRGESALGSVCVCRETTRHGEVVWETLESDLEMHTQIHTHTRWKTAKTTKRQWGKLCVWFIKSGDDENSTTKNWFTICTKFEITFSPKTHTLENSARREVQETTKLTSNSVGCLIPTVELMETSVCFSFGLICVCLWVYACECMPVCACVWPACAERPQELPV